MIDVWSRIPTIRKVLPGLLLTLLFTGAFLIAAYSLVLGGMAFVRSQAKGPTSVFSDITRGAAFAESDKRCLQKARIPFQIDDAGNVRVHDSNFNAAISACS
jgi:hypothetical protein